MPAAVDDEVDLGPEAPNFPPLPAPVQPVPDSPVPERSGSIPAPPVMPAPPKPLQGVIPAQTLDDPRYQQQVERETMAIAQRAKSYDQAQHDVSSARRILGMLKADRERQTMERAGVPPGEAMQKAMFQNMHFFVQPGDKNFAPSVNAVRPVAPPSIQNFPIPGTTNQIPAFVTPTRTGTNVRPIPQNAIPRPEDTSTSTPAKPILSDKGELLGYTVKTGPQTFSHKWLADMDTGVKQQIKNNDLEIRELIREKHTIEKEAASSGDKPNQSKLQENMTRMHELQQKNIDLATGKKQQPSTGDAPNAPINPDLRRAGQIYKTPKGVFKWTGSGWQTSE